MIDAKHGWNTSYKPQFIGFVSSILLIFASYLMVVHFHLPGMQLAITVFAFAVAQALLQLFFFLHLGLESKPHWVMITFLFTILVMVIVVGGTLWIMSNLNYNLMPPMNH